MASAPSATLSRQQIRDLAQQAGFPDNQLDMAVEVAMKESGGNPRAHNGNASTGDNSYGLWQINMIGSMGPVRRKDFKISSNEQLFDPATNARAAKRIYDQAGGSWRPWSTADSARAALGTPNTDDNADSTGSSASSSIVTGGVNSAIDQFTEKFRLAAVTYLIFLVALILFIMGVVILNRDKAGKAAGLALDVVPGGGIAKKIVKVAK